jgi:hypothetical protein
VARIRTTLAHQGSAVEELSKYATQACEGQSNFGEAQGRLSAAQGALAGSGNGNRPGSRKAARPGDETLWGDYFWA